MCVLRFQWNGVIYLKSEINRYPYIVFPPAKILWPIPQHMRFLGLCIGVNGLVREGRAMSNLTMLHLVSKSPLWKFGILLSVVIGIAACGNGSNSGNSSCSSVPGEVTTNIGSTTGGEYSIGYLGGGLNISDMISFNNTSLIFFGNTVGGSGITYIDSVGQVCLDGATTWPGNTGTNAAAIVGNTYIIKYYDGYVRFTEDSYANGIATITYVVGGVSP